MIITGASDGIGKEAAYQLATQNAHVILGICLFLFSISSLLIILNIACRSKSKADPIVQDIRRGK